MDSILSNFSIENNFWKENPHFLIVKLFKQLYKNDKSRAKTRSSKIMWSIALLEHPDSKFSNVSRSERIQIISEDYLEKEEGWVEKYEDLREKFIELSPTRNQRFLQQWGDKLDERMDVLNGTPYTIENAETLDKIMANTDKLWRVYQKCLADVQDEKDKGQVQGGAMESLTEQGLI